MVKLRMTAAAMIVRMALWGVTGVVATVLA